MAVYVLLMLSLCRVASAQLWITAYNASSSADDQDIQYVDNTLFSTRYANVDSLQGFVHSLTPNNGCTPLIPVPDDLNGSWFALITDYPSCAQDMLFNVRAAGYALIIASSSNDSDMAVTKNIKDSGFPIVIVTESFASTLRENVSSDSFENPQLGVMVTASLGLSVFVVVFSFVSCCLCSCLVGCCVCLCRNRRSRLREEQEFYEYRDRQRNYEQVQRRERFARQELIESILRQLQELQVDLRTQIPLGHEETNRLPTRPYRSGHSKCDTCAICVEEFQQGESLRWLPCEHSFHPQCIDEWLTNHSSLCPLCKAAVPRGDDDGTSSDSDSSSSSSIPLLRERPLLNNDRRYGSV